MFARCFRQLKGHADDVAAEHCRGLAGVTLGLCFRSSWARGRGVAVCGVQSQLVSTRHAHKDLRGNTDPGTSIGAEAFSHLSFALPIRSRKVGSDFISGTRDH
jgi:hypothetical protein